MRGIAARPGQPDAQTLGHAVDPIGDQLDRARAHAGLRQRSDEPRHQQRQPVLDRLGGGDRLGKALGHGDRLGRNDRVERLADPPAGLVEPQHQQLAEAAGERRTRHGAELTDRLDAKPLEQFDRTGLGPQRAR